MDDRKKDLTKLIVGIVAFILALLFKKTLHYTLLAISYLILGYEVIKEAFENVKDGEYFDENTLMTIATIAAAILGEFNEAVFVMMFYDIGEFLQDLATDKSRDHIKDLINLQPVNVHIDGKDVKPEDVLVGDVYTVLPGEKVQIDGIVVEGQTTIDTKYITGESVPVNCTKGYEIISGSVVLDSPITIRATKLYSNSTLSRMVKLIEEEGSQASTEKFITKFARYYTPIVVGLGFLLAVIPSLITKDWHTWTYRALNFLVISCPCALIISIPLSFFAGIGNCARKGILVKGAENLETLSKSEAVVFDKTGTLTKGEFKVQQIITANDFSEKEILQTAASLESSSIHPIAKAIVQHCNESGIKAKKVADLVEMSGLGLSGMIGKKQVLVGNEKLMAKNKIKYNNKVNFGTVVHIAKDGIYMGCIVISDTIKESAKETVEDLKTLGIKRTIMLSGDNKKAAKQVADKIGLDEFYAELLPEDKTNKMKELKAQYVCTYCGDGINDIPVMLESDTSISMGTIGSDAAIEASNIVFTNDDISKLKTALNISKKTVRIARQNIALALLVKIACMILGMAGVTGLSVAVFADTGVALLAVLNSLRALY